MAQEVINIGALADDGTGDTIRGAGIKINNNFTELYATEMGQSQIEFVQNEIYTTESNSGTSPTFSKLLCPEASTAHVWPDLHRHPATILYRA